MSESSPKDNGPSNVYKSLTITSDGASIEIRGNGWVTVYDSDQDLVMSVSLNPSLIRELSAFIKSIGKPSVDGIGCEGGEA
jgi:hypothetical protein